MGGSETKTQTVQNNDPWAPAQPYLLAGLQNAQRIYNDQEAKGTKFEGPFVAQPTQRQTDGANNLLGFATGTGQSAIQSQLASGQSMTNAGAGQTGSTIDAMKAFAGRDATSQNLASASAYANNPYLQSQIDAATRDASRQYNEQTVPGINANAAGTGNINSTRTGVAQGIAQRGLQDTIADTSAKIRSQAWSQGLNAAQQDAATQLAALQGTGQLSSALTNSGINQTNAGWNGLQNNTNAYTIGNAMVSANNQAPIDEKLAEVDYANTQPWQNLQNEWSIFSDGGRQGGTMVSNSTQKTNPGALGILGGITGILGSFMKCDLHTKDVISKVGCLTTGEPIYLFRYKDDPTQTVHFGPMAQDVEVTKPDAVFEVDGIKHINLAALVAALEGGRA